MGSGLAGLVSGLGSISPGLSFLGSSARSPPSSFRWAWSSSASYLPGGRCKLSGARRQVSGGRCKVGGARCQVSGDARVQVSHLSRHWAAVLPTMGAMVRHWVGISLARCSSFSSSSFAHSVFLIEGSSHSNHRAWGLERMRWAKRMYRLMRMKRAGHLALLGALPVEQGGDPAPLVLAVPGEG